MSVSNRKELTMTDRNLSRFIIIVCLFILGCSATVSAIDNSAAMLTVPDAKRGAAEVPLLFDYTHQRAQLSRKANCTVSYDLQAIIFSFTIPVKSGYKPTGLNERDGIIWNDDRVEIFLQPNGKGSVTQYIINAVGALYDSRDRDKSWNGNPDYKVTTNADNWQVQARITFVELGMNPADGSILRGNVAVNSNEPGNNYCLTWVHLPVDFADVASWGTFKLSSSQSFIKKIDLSDIVYTPTGAHIKAEYTPETGAVISDNIPLSQVKNAIVDFKSGESFAYKAEIINDLVPFIELIAMDPYRFSVVLRNADVLKEFVETVELTVDGKKVLRSSLKDLSRKYVSSKSWKPGDHKFDYTFLNKSGTVFASLSNTIFTFKPGKSDYDISKLDASRYYPSVGFRDGKVSASVSSFDLSKGILPSQISVNGVPILEKPVQIVFDGKPLLAAGKVRKVSSNKNQVRLVSKSLVGEKTLTIQADHQYDGFTWYDVSLKSDKPFEYGKLEIVIPLKLDSDILMSYETLFHDYLFREAKDSKTGKLIEPKELDYSGDTLCHGRLLKDGEKLNVPLTDFVSLSTDTDEKYRGLGVSLEGPRGWNVKNYDSTYQITRGENGRVNLVILISDGLKRLHTREVKFLFGLEPFPVRAFRNDFHKDFRIDCTFWPKGWEQIHTMPDGTLGSFLDKVATEGVKIEHVHENWTTFEGYWKPGGNELDMDKYVAAAKKAGVDLSVYFNSLMSDKIPEFPLYHDLLMTKPNSYPDGGFRPYIYYQQGDPDQSSFGICANSIWYDRLAEGIGEAVKRYDLRSVYYDAGMLVPSACSNQKHGCGVIDPYGRMIVTFAVRACRRFGEMVYSEGLKNRKDFIVDQHAGWPYPPALGLVEGYWTGEASSLFEPVFSRTGPDSLRAMMNGKLYGVGCDMLKRPEAFLSVCWAQGLLLDAYPRLTEGAGKDYLEASQKLWGLYDKYNLTSDTFTPYFVRANKVIKDNPNIFVSYYETDKVLIAVVSNYWNEKTQPVTLDFNAFKGLKSKCRDAWGNVDYELVNNKLSTTVDGLMLKLLVIEKN